MAIPPYLHHRPDVCHDVSLYLPLSFVLLLHGYDGLGDPATIDSDSRKMMKSTVFSPQSIATPTRDDVGRIAHDVLDVAVMVATKDVADIEFCGKVHEFSVVVRT